MKETPCPMSPWEREYYEGLEATMMDKGQAITGGIYNSRSLENMMWNTRKMENRHRNTSMAQGRVNGQYLSHGNKRT